MLQMPHLNLAGRIPDPWNRRPREVERVAVEVQHGLNDVRVHDVARCFDRRRHRADRCRRLLQQGIHSHVNRPRIQQRLISLDVHKHVALFARRHFRDAFRSGTVLRPRHPRLAAKSLHGSCNAFIICSHNHAVRSLGHLCTFVDPLNHRFAR